MINQIAVLGSEGTFCDSASVAYGQRRAQNFSETFYPTFEDTFHAVGEDCPYGILPIENTLDGYVQRTLDLLLECEQQQLRIVDEITVPVQFSLVARTRSFEKIRRLYVQFKANGQCRKMIQKMPQVKIITTENNVESYEKLLAGKDGDAAIIPHHLYQSSRFSFGIEDVTDRSNNYTRFVILRHGERSWPKDCPHQGKTVKAALYFLPEEDDKPGLLHEFLSEFSTRKINMISIMSRPTKRKIGTYHFFVEVNAPLTDWTFLLETFETLKKQYPIEVLGIYPVE